MDVIIQDSTQNRRTALHVAGIREFSEIVALVLAANAGPNIGDQNRGSAIIDASANGQAIHKSILTMKISRSTVHVFQQVIKLSWFC